MASAGTRGMRMKKGRRFPSIGHSAMKCGQLCGNPYGIPYLNPSAFKMNKDTSHFLRQLIFILLN